MRSLEDLNCGFFNSKFGQLEIDLIYGVVTLDYVWYALHLLYTVRMSLNEWPYQALHSGVASELTDRHIQLECRILASALTCISLQLNYDSICLLAHHIRYSVDHFHSPQFPISSISGRTSGYASCNQEDLSSIYPCVVEHRLHRRKFITMHSPNSLHIANVAYSSPRTSEGGVTVIDQLQVLDMRHRRPSERPRIHVEENKKH